MKVLSIRQPWAWLIVNGHKDIENRSWPTRFRGQFLVHASKGMTNEEYDDVAHMLDEGICLPEKKLIERGGIVGIAEIVDCVSWSDSPWFMGEHGFVLRNARPLPFYPLRGMLGFFEAPADYVVPA
jgi:hypothetical protein